MLLFPSFFVPDQNITYLHLVNSVFENSLCSNNSKTQKMKGTYLNFSMKMHNVWIFVLKWIWEVWDYCISKSFTEGTWTIFPGTLTKHDKFWVQCKRDFDTKVGQKNVIKCFEIRKLKFINFIFSRTRPMRGKCW